MGRIGTGQNGARMARGTLRCLLAALCGGIWPLSCCNCEKGAYPFDFRSNFDGGMRMGALEFPRRFLYKGHMILSKKM